MNELFQWLFIVAMVMALVFAGCLIYELAREVEGILKRESARHGPTASPAGRAKKSWEDWDREEVKRECEPWPKEEDNDGD